VRELITGVPNLQIIETVDSTKLAAAISKECQNHSRNIAIFLQVNTSGEDQKSGLEPSDAVKVWMEIASNNQNLYSHVTLKGLMTIGKLGGYPTGDFKSLVKVAEEVKNSMKEKFPNKDTEVELSMGMSADYPQAIEAGSTNIRVGSTIFGERHYKH